MRVAKLVEVGKIRVEEAPEPLIVNADDVKVKVMAVGICGTDLHIFKEGRGDVSLPRVMGHELSGEVVAVGNGVTRLNVGDRVALDPVFACGKCPACKKGYPNVCDTVRCFGVQMDGGYQDYIVVGEKHLYPFSGSVSFDNAALAEPFSIGSNIVDRTAVKADENILIIGSGTIGLSIVQMAKSVGANVMVADIVDKKLNVAAQMGADKTVNSKQYDLKAEAERFSPGGFDVVVDAVGITPLFVQSLEYAAPRARVACIGFDSTPAAIPPILVTKKELSIIGSRMNCNRFPEVMELLEKGSIYGNRMISRRYSVKDIQKAFEETIASSADCIKNLIVFH